MESLETIFKKYPPDHHPEHHGDKGTNHSYLGTYERLFSPLRSKKKLRVLEIGIAGGLSLKMWRDYFHPTTTIVGCDIRDAWLTEDVKRDFPLVIANSKVPTTRELIEKHGPFDIIIDDGDHNPWSQILTWHNAFPLLRKGGIYVIEDISNLPHWEHEFKALSRKVEVVDLREVKKRKDDVLIIYRK